MGQLGWEGIDGVMAHSASSMTRVEHPSQGFSEVIAGIENPRDMSHNNIASVFPLLDSKVLDVDVARAVGRHFGINHVNSRHVVFI